jgi:hypothetical protein
MLEISNASSPSGDPGSLSGVLDALAEQERVKAAACARQAELLALGVVLAQREGGGAGAGAGGGAVGVSFSPSSPARRRELVMRSFISEVGCALRMAEGTVGRLVCDAQTLTADLPDTLAALRSGGIACRHAQILAQHALTLPPEARHRFEQQALPAARELTPARFDVRARRLREEEHPESIRVRHEQAAQSRCVFFEADRDGMAWLHHRLAAVDALAIDDTLDRIARAMRSENEPRSQSQLRADALTDALLVSARSPDTDHGSDAAESAPVTVLPGFGRAAIVPTVIVTVPVLTLLGHTDQPGELEGYGPIDPVTARRLAGQAPTFLRMLTDPNTGDTHSVGPNRYRPTADLRLALQLADSTCRFPGCGRRAARCELDHCHDWANGGATRPENLHHLCPKHHHLKHESTWTVQAGPGRDLNWTSPTGRHYTTTPVPRRAAIPPPAFTGADPPPVAPP